MGTRRVCEFSRIPCYLRFSVGAGLFTNLFLLVIKTHEREEHRKGNWCKRTSGFGGLNLFFEEKSQKEI